MLRALAACGVVLFHAGGSSVGAAGVDLFFVISGYVIASVINQRTPGDFLIDRAARIYPLYWLALLPWASSAYHAGDLDAQRLLTDGLLFPGWFIHVQPLLVLSWTLAFEMLFYSAAAIALKLNNAGLVVAGYLSCALGWAITGAEWLAWLGNPIIFEFLFGILIFRARKVARLAPWTILAGAVLLISNPDQSRSVFELSSALGRACFWGIPAALIVYGLVSIEHRLTSPAAKALAWLGVASYSIYLFHPVLVVVAGEAWWVKFIVGVSGGILGWLVFERNFEKVRKHWRRWRARDVSTSGARSDRNAQPITDLPNRPV